jgi:uncharacterized protein (DUF1778 family)
VLVFAGRYQHVPLEQIAVRVDGRLKRAVDAACRGRGVSLTRFVQDALLDKLEEIADAEDVPRLRREPTRPLRDLIRDLGLDGEL